MPTLPFRNIPSSLESKLLGFKAFGFQGETGIHFWLCILLSQPEIHIHSYKQVCQELNNALKV